MRQKVSIDASTSTRRIQMTLAQIVDLLRVRPNSGRLWLDAIYLLLIASVHLSVAPTILRSAVTLDLITPWLVVSFVTQSLPRAAFLGLLGATLLETHSSAPAGLYMCSYWVILSVLVLVRSPLSWRHRFPWIVTFALAELWVIGFECFVLGLNSGMAPFDWMFVSGQILRLLLAAGFGLILVRRWSSIDPSSFDDEVPV